MSDLPEPLVPPEVDLRDFPFMPLDVLRLRDSDLAAVATGEEFKAAVLLWCAAWHQVPAGSLPNDERWLARHSGAGPGWKKVREEALRGFVACSDGRLYHSVVAEKANESWAKKQEQRVRTLKARIASTEKRFRDATNDNDRSHAQAQLQALQRDLSQLLSQPLLHPPRQGQSQGLLQPPPDPLLQRPRDSKGTGTVKGQGQGNIPEPVGSGARGARATLSTDPVKDEIWRTGRSLLEAQGESKDAAGTFLGKLCKEFGQRMVLDALRDADKTRPAEAKAWLVARCQERKPANRQEALESRNAAVARAALEDANGPH